MKTIPLPSKGKRFVINKKENWMLTPHQRRVAQGIEHILKTHDSVILTDIYTQLRANGSSTQYKILYLLMFMWKLGLVRMKRRGGVCIIRWREKRK